MKNVTKILMAFLLAFVVSNSMMSTQVFAAGGINEGATACNTADFQDGAIKCNEASDLKTKMITAVKVLTSLVAVFAIGMIIYGGFRYIAAQGEPKQVETAKSQIWHAGIGLFIVLTAFTIFKFFVGASSGSW